MTSSFNTPKRLLISPTSSIISLPNCPVTKTVGLKLVPRLQHADYQEETHRRHRGVHSRYRSCAVTIRCPADSGIYELIVCLARVVCLVEHHLEDTRASLKTQALGIIQSVRLKIQQTLKTQYLPDNK